MVKSDNLEREQRILDVAADLFAHYGYDKTPVSDIARQAGVSQGTIYLHFSSKDELFEELLVREMVNFADSWLGYLEADPRGGTIGGMYKNMLYALNDNAFMAAMLKQDRRVFGSYLRKPGNFFRNLEAQQSESPRFAFVKMMQDAGAMRADLDPKIVAHIMNMLAYGLVGLDDVLPAAAIPPLEDVIEGIATIMDRALTPEEMDSSDVGKGIVRQVAESSKQLYEQVRSAKRNKK